MGWLPVGWGRWGSSPKQASLLPASTVPRTSGGWHPSPRGPQGTYRPPGGLGLAWWLQRWLLGNGLLSRQHLEQRKGWEGQFGGCPGFLGPAQSPLAAAGRGQELGTGDVAWNCGPCACSRRSREHPREQRWHPRFGRPLPASRCCRPPRTMGPQDIPNRQGPTRVKSITRLSAGPPKNRTACLRPSSKHPQTRSLGAATTSLGTSACRCPTGVPRTPSPPARTSIPALAAASPTAAPSDARSPPASTDDAGVLVVPAVVLPPAQVEAVGQPRLAAGAPHVVQQHGPAAEAEEAEDGGGDGVAAAQLPAHHLRVGEVPVVVADGAPGAAVPHLHPPAAAPVAVRQPHAATCGWAPAQPRGGGGP